MDNAKEIKLRLLADELIANNYPLTVSELLEELKLTEQQAIRLGDYLLIEVSDLWS